MTAPSLILLGHGSNDPRVAQVSQQIRRELLTIRPELDIHVAFLDNAAPSGLQIAERLAGEGVTEIVFVPLLLSDAFQVHCDVPALVAQVTAAHPDLRVAASRPIGPEAQLLAIVDRRLRDALRVNRVSELDGLIFAAEGSSDVRSNALVARRARQWSTHHRLPCVTAYASGSGPSTAEAIRSLRAQGRRHIAMGSWFLAPGLQYTHQAELALDAGAIAIAAPLGGEPEVAEVALIRYVVSALELVDVDAPVEHEPVFEDEDFFPIPHLSVVSA